MLVLRYILLFSTLCLGACAALKPPAQSIVIPPSNDVQLAEVLKTPEQLTTAKVRWGGTIIKSEQVDNYLRVEVLQRPLSDQGKPDVKLSSDGRFIALIPLVEGEKKTKRPFFKNRLVSVFGEFIGVEKLPVGKDKTQSLAVVQVSDAFTWRDQQYRPFGVTCRYDGYFGYSHFVRNGYFYSPYYASLPPHYRCW